MGNQRNEDKKQTETPTRSLMLWLLAGCYLIYTGYRLCRDVINGVDGGGIGFMLAGIAFCAIGAVLVFFGGKGMLNADKLRNEQSEADAEEPEEVMEEIPEEVTEEDEEQETEE